MIPSSCAACGLAAAELVTGDRYRAAVGLHGAGDDPHHRRLAGSVLTDEGDHFAPAEDQARDVEDGHRTVRLADAGEDKVPTGVRHDNLLWISRH